jgi:type IV secretory pathway VirB3-like protein
MKFAKIVFWIAGIWGVLILTPLYFMFDAISRNDPPAITHPGFYYGFVSVALAWQVAFLVIARDPVRFRLMMIPAVLEKFGWGASLLVLYFQNRIHPSDLALGGVDMLLGVLFLLAFFRT